jgi:hypothetical protein
VVAGTGVAVAVCVELRVVRPVEEAPVIEVFEDELGEATKTFAIPHGKVLDVLGPIYPVCRRDERCTKLVFKMMSRRPADDVYSVLIGNQQDVVGASGRIRVNPVVNLGLLQGFEGDVLAERRVGAGARLARQAGQVGARVSEADSEVWQFLARGGTISVPEAFQVELQVGDRRMMSTAFSSATSRTWWERVGTFG